MRAYINRQGQPSLRHPDGRRLEIYGGRPRFVRHKKVSKRPQPCFTVTETQMIWARKEMRARERCLFKEAVAIGLKMYLVLEENQKNIRKAKGVKRDVMEITLSTSTTKNRFSQK